MGAVTGSIGAGTVETASSAGTPTWVNILLAVAGSAIVANLLGAFLTRLRAGADARRVRYAQAARLLVARAEYPYRIRRRTSDDQATLTALADRGHDLQEQLGDARAWITGESRALGGLYGRTLLAIDEEAGPACQTAWCSAPVTSPSDMNIRDFGPRGTQKHVDAFTSAVHYRFGWRRALPTWYLTRHLTRSDV
jgi:hypothetical protein